MGLELAKTDPKNVPKLIGYDPKIQSGVSEISYNFKSCSELAGSFTKSCEVTYSQYQSSDYNLKNTELCEVKVNCLKLDGTSRIYTSTIYSNINEKAEAKTVQFLENCDGKIVIGNLDDQCVNFNEEHAKKGKSGKIMRA
jgi:hypothetical protein